MYDDFLFYVVIPLNIVLIIISLMPTKEDDK
jgi:hypothetical protein